MRQHRRLRSNSRYVCRLQRLQPCGEPSSGRPQTQPAADRRLSPSCPSGSGRHIKVHGRAREIGGAGCSMMSVLIRQAAAGTGARACACGPAFGSISAREAGDKSALIARMASLRCRAPGKLADSWFQDKPFFPGLRSKIKCIARLPHTCGAHETRLHRKAAETPSSVFDHTAMEISPKCCFKVPASATWHTCSHTHGSRPRLQKLDSIPPREYHLQTPCLCSRSQPPCC